jgi:Carboxypeptidase regulatory-like domain
LLFGFAVRTSFARAATGTLEGTVLDAHGRALPGATVTIQTSDGTHPHVTRTDAAGHFVFARWAAGQYDLRAYRKGSYSEWAKRILVRSQTSTSITLRVEP